MMRALPEDVLVLVLRHVDQAERVSSCALVSNAWAEAAAMASDAIQIHTDDTELFMPWLQHHGSHVTKFTCAYKGAFEEEEAKGVLSTLPCRNLLELTLDKWEIVLGPMDGCSGILHAATGLSSLHLNLDEPEDLWDGLSACTALHALPALQHVNLSVRGIYHYELSDEYMLPSCVISGLTTLTRLELSGGLALESLQPFSCLTTLQHLSLNLDVGVEDAGDALHSGQQPFKQLQALTHLSMRLNGCKLVSTSSSPAFSGCTGLQDLCFFGVYTRSVDASAFCGLTGLTKLHLWVAAVVETGAAGVAAALLGHISRMQQLQDLALVRGRLAATVSLRDVEAAACGALTASTNLKSVDVSGLRLPRAAWAHLFPPSRRLLQLQKFELCFSGTDAIDIARFDCSASEQLVDCCPAIQSLSFSNMSLFEEGLSLAPLLRLQQLTQLECPYVVDGDACVGVLARLSSLRNLRLRVSAGLTDVGLLQLTALTGLQELGVIVPHTSSHSLSAMEMMREGTPGGRCAALSATPGCKPDVWYQLLLASAATTECQATLDEQLPAIMQQLQDSAHDTTAFERAREVSRARAREAEIAAALEEAKAGVAAAKAQLLEQMETDRQGKQYPGV